MSFTETLQSLTGKLLADCTDQELYLALLELVRQKSADRVQPVTGRKLYYISAEFLIGKLLSNNLINLGLYEEARMHWPLPESVFPILRKWNRSLLSATAVRAAWPPASWIRWPPSTCPATAWACVTTSACSSSPSRTACRTSCPTRG